LSFGGRLARVALIAAVAAAIGAGTLPALLNQATPTEEAIARIAPLPPRPSEGGRFATVAPAPLPMPMDADATPAAFPADAEPAVEPPAAVVASIAAAAEPPVMAQAEPPAAATAASTASPPAAVVPTASAILEPFPSVQSLTIAAAENVPPPVEQVVPQPEAPAVTASLPPRTAEKPAWRKHAAGNRAAQRKSVRPKPFSIRALLAALHLR